MNIKLALLQISEPSKYQILSLSIQQKEQGGRSSAPLRLIICQGVGLGEGRITREELLPLPSSKNPACPFQGTGLKLFTTLN